MRIRYFSFISLGVAAAFLVVATQSFVLPDIVNVSLGVGIGMVVVSLGIAARYRKHLPSLLCGLAAALVSAWMVVASQVFSPQAVQNLTFAEALGIAGLALIGLTAHELSTERVFHSLEMRAGAPVPESPREEMVGIRS
jgi:hypothetical protein